MKQKIDVRNSFDGDLYVFGGHYTKEEIEPILRGNADVEDYEEIYKVEHEWATFGMMPEDIREEQGQHGWWIIDNPNDYKRKKKVTAIFVKHSNKIPDKCPSCRSSRVHLCEGKGECLLCGCKFGYTPLTPKKDETELSISSKEPKNDTIKSEAL